MEELAIAVTLARGAIDTAKDAYHLMPSDKAEDLAEKLEEAEKQLAIAEAKIATELGYTLCQCTFPPQIMLYDKTLNRSLCPACGNSLKTQMFHSRR